MEDRHFGNDAELPGDEEIGEGYCDKKTEERHKRWREAK